MLKNDMNGFSKILVVGYACMAVCMLIYSYTQVDLGLTLIEKNIWQTIQTSLQSIGYFNRPLSTVFFCILVGLSGFLYAITLWAVHRRMVTARTLWIIIMMMAIILPFSYPAFSYDLFNYMFTAKTILVYHKNPYTAIPLQFTGVDPWLGFMHWTHKGSAYSPLWIGVTLPLYLLGCGVFLLTMWSFKFFLAGCFMLVLFCIWKIGKKNNDSHALYGLALVALNPLILIESLVSSHNDIAMIACAMAALYMYERRRMIWAFVFYAWSAALKLITLAMLPALVCKRKYECIAVCMSAAVVFFCLVFHRELLSWYLLWAIPFYGLLRPNKYITTAIFGISMAILLSYAPFLRFGIWDDLVFEMRLWVIFYTFVGTCVVGLILWLRDSHPRLFPV